MDGFTCNLKIYRVRKGMTQGELALKLAVDISRAVEAPIEAIFVFD